MIHSRKVKKFFSVSEEIAENSCYIYNIFCYSYIFYFKLIINFRLTLIIYIYFFHKTLLKIFLPSLKIFWELSSQVPILFAALANANPEWTKSEWTQLETGVVISAAKIIPFYQSELFLADSLAIFLIYFLSPHSSCWKKNNWIKISVPGRV